MVSGVSGLKVAQTKKNIIGLMVNLMASIPSGLKVVRKKSRANTKLAKKTVLGQSTMPLEKKNQLSLMLMGVQMVNGHCGMQTEIQNRNQNGKKELSPVSGQSGLQMVKKVWRAR